MTPLPLSVLAAMWWRRVCNAVYEATHKPDSRWLDDWADELHRMNAKTHGDKGLTRIDGVLYRRTWAGLIRVETPDPATEMEAVNG